MLQTWFFRYRNWRARRQAISILHSFDDRKLTDLGTFRDRIELFVEHAARNMNRSEP